MKTKLETTQDLIQQNLTPGYFDEYLATREVIIGKLKGKNNKPYSAPAKQTYLESGKTLVGFMIEYAAIANEVNPIIAEYNEIVNDTLENHPTELTQLNEIALELLRAYRNTNIRDLRRRVGILRMRKRIWLKMDIPYRDKLYRNLDGAAKMIEEARKMYKRKKRLDAQVTYPYWLW